MGGGRPRMFLEKFLVPDLFALIGDAEEAILRRSRRDEQDAEKAEKNRAHVRLYTICSASRC
jgi:adenylate kinase